MLNRRLLEIISRLSPQERKRLRQFILSPYFTYGISNQEIIKLFDHIVVTCAADENHPGLDKKATNNLLFPDKPFVEKGKNPIDTLTTDLMRLTKKFLFIETVQEEQKGSIQDLPLARAYRKFGLEERFHQVVGQIRKEMDETSVRDSNYFLQRFRVENEVMHFKSLYNSSEDDANLNTANQFLDKYFAINKLDAGCAMQHQKVMAAFDQEISAGFFHLILHQIEEGFYKDDPNIEIYSLVHQLIKKPDDTEMLRQFETCLMAAKETMHFDQCRDMHAYLRSFYTRRYIRTGSPDALKQLFFLMSDHLEAGYMYADGKVMNAALRNITRAGLRLGEVEKVLAILHAHPPELIGGTAYPHEFYNLNLADYYFALGDFDKAQETIDYKSFEDINFSIHADIILLKIYFETKSELLENRIQALTQKIRRSKLSAERKSRYNHFLRNLEKINKYAWDTNSQKRVKLADEIRNSETIVEREWLLSKVT